MRRAGGRRGGRGEKRKEKRKERLEPRRRSGQQEKNLIYTLATGGERDECQLWCLSSKHRLRGTSADDKLGSS